MELNRTKNWEYNKVLWGEIQVGKKYSRDGYADRTVIFKNDEYILVEYHHKNGRRDPSAFSRMDKFSDWKEVS